MQNKHSVEFIEHVPTAPKAITSRRVGMIIFGIGVVYIFIVSGLSTWWIVPLMREIGLYGFSTAVMIWAVSAPLGALLLAVGGAAVAPDRRFWVAVIATMLIVLWLSSGPISQVIPPLFGIGGSLIMLSFLGCAWNWIKLRPQLSAAARPAADLQMLGQVFFFIAAWNLCGLMGAPTFVLRPELSQQFDMSALAINVGTAVLIFLTIGWGCIFFSQRMRKA